MPWYLGIDTSNYTTSAALYHSGTGEIRQRKRLLPVREGEVGLRQSDAVFLQVKQLGPLVEELFSGTGCSPRAVAASFAPRDEEGSYMPCFLAGEMAGRSAAAVLGAPFYRFSHQAGHVMAAVHSAGRTDLLEGEFLAWHISGGTTDCLLVSPHPRQVIEIQPVARSLDLHAGQAVDRVGAMLGLGFPAGPALEELAGRSSARFRPRISLKGLNCCLSGVENQCRALSDQGASPCDVAAFCLCFLRETLLEMSRRAAARYPGLPMAYAGGVMENKGLRRAVAAEFPACFAAAGFSSDNAAGTAVLCGLRVEKGGGL